MLELRSADPENPPSSEKPLHPERVHVLFANRLYWPDTHLLRTLAVRLAASGLRVEVLTQQPTYKKINRTKRFPPQETEFGVELRRLGVIPGARTNNTLMLLDKAIFPARVFFNMIVRRLRGKTPDYIVVLTMPPVLIGFGAALSSMMTGARMVYYFQDIYPELSAAYGMTNPRTWFYRLAMAVDRWNMRRAYRCVTLSSDMVETLAKRGISRDKIVIINNFLADNFEDNTAGVPEEFRRDPSIKRVIFAGNLGRFQHLDAILATARKLSTPRPDIEFVFMGDGIRAAYLRNEARKLDNVRFFSHQTVEIANAIVADASAGFVSLAPHIHEFAFPSKTLTYMALGVPIIGVIEDESDLSQLVRTHDLGAIAQDDSPEAIAAAVEHVVDHGYGAQDRRNRIKDIYHRLFDLDIAVARWREILSAEASENSQT